MEILGFSFDIVAQLWVFIALGVIIGIIGVFMFLYMNRMHPKKGFKVYSRTGVHTRSWRLYRGHTPTEADIFSILLGKKPIGFPISWFRREYYDKKEFVVCQYIDGRIIPLPLEDMLGNTQFVNKVCPNCKEEGFNDEEKDCPKCGNKFEWQTVMLSALHLQRLKFSREIEQRRLYTEEITSDKRLPLSEYLELYDVGAKIAEAMTQNIDDTKAILDQNNPFITALIASLPLAIIMIGFGFSAYVMWMGMGDAMNTNAQMQTHVADTMMTIAQNLPTWNGTNATGI